MHSNSIERIREGLRPGDVEQAITAIVDDELGSVTEIAQPVLNGEVQTFYPTRSTRQFRRAYPAP